VSHLNAASVMLKIDLTLDGVGVMEGKSGMEIFTSQSSSQQ
jgi:hypothetical protein